MTKPSPSGILVVDKPSGCTSHDVVAKVRKALQTRKVGHCGTLDPMATGVLVVAVGQGTKLVPYLTADDKHYEASLRLGVATDSLDADGEVTETASVPPLTQEVVQTVADGFLGPHAQRAPRVSAIKVNGQRLHARARRGESFEAPLRDVVLHSVNVDEVAEDAVRFRLHAAKGFYVRSFGRDLAAKLGTVGHLNALRRTASGAFGLDRSVALEGLTAASLIPLETAVGWVMDTVNLAPAQFEDASHGRRVDGLVGEGQVAALYEGKLVALLERVDGSGKVLRGFA